jgi:hypothetical protein
MSTEKPAGSDPDVGRFEGEGQHGWSPDIDAVVSKDERTAGEGGRKAFDASNAGEPGPGGTVSRQEAEGVSPTDTTAASPLGVGVSTTRRGEDIAKEHPEPGHHDTGPQGASQRPSGTSSAERATGIDPQDPIDEDSPNLTPGS